MPIEQHYGGWRARCRREGQRVRGPVRRTLEEAEHDLTQLQNACRDTLADLRARADAMTTEADLNKAHLTLVEVAETRELRELISWYVRCASSSDSRSTARQHSLFLWAFGFCESFGARAFGIGSSCAAGRRPMVTRFRPSISLGLRQPSSSHLWPGRQPCICRVEESRQFLLCEFRAAVLLWLWAFARGYCRATIVKGSFGCARAATFPAAIGEGWSMGLRRPCSSLASGVSDE